MLSCILIISVWVNFLKVLFLYVIQKRGFLRDKKYFGIVIGLPNLKKKKFGVYEH